MAVNRREFMRIAGLSAVGAAAGTTLHALAQDHPSEQSSLSGQRWAMVIDVKKCLRQDGCRQCIQACHQAHNVPQFDNVRHEVKWIWKDKYEHGFPNQHHEYAEEDLKGQDVLVLCNHCDKPPCVRVCPTKATFRRDNDGIVMMDMHRCIGCRFCVAACPYGSRSFNWVDPRGKRADGTPLIDPLNPDFPTRCKGVVEKCNFCAERLARGELPACVDVCPENALLFGDLADPDSEVRQVLRTRHTIRRLPGLGTKPQVFYIV
jgi:molybdopterin-containing oxidoreductase family iron-sulfur binding subunit